MFYYKCNIIKLLKDCGYSSYKVQKYGTFSNSTMQAFRENKMVSIETIGKLCALLNCQPGDLIGWQNVDPIRAKHSSKSADDF